MNDADSIPTRQTLLARLKDWQDQASWREFFDTYWRLIHNAALKAGLTQAEAQEVVQEVMLAAAKKLPDFVYDPAKDSLKGWLLRVTRWKVGDQFRRREAHGCLVSADPENGRAARSGRGEGETARTSTVQRVPDPHSIDIVWEEEWRENLIRTALGRVKLRVSPAHYEMYHLQVIQGLSARETARALETSSAAVYLAKHRVGKLVRAELKSLESSRN